MSAVLTKTLGALYSKLRLGDGMSVRCCMMFLVTTSLAGCAPPPPPSPAEQADAGACTAQADAIYNAQNDDALSRTSQNGLYFAPTPNHVFDAERQGALHVRDSQIAACESQGNNDQRAAYGAPLVTPHIVATP